MLVRSASDVEYESPSWPHALAMLGNEYRRITGEFPYAKSAYSGNGYTWTFVDGQVIRGSVRHASIYLDELVRRVKMTWVKGGLPDILTVVTVACAQMRIDKQWIPKPDADMMTDDAVWTSDRIYQMFMGRAEFPKLEKRDHTRAIAAINHLRKQKGLRKADKALRRKLVEIATRERNQNKVYMHEVGYVACVAAYAAHGPEQYARRDRWKQGYDSKHIGTAGYRVTIDHDVTVTHVIPLPPREGVRKSDGMPYRYLGYLYKVRDLDNGNVYQWIAYERSKSSHDYIGRLRVGDTLRLMDGKVKLHTSHTARGHEPVKITEFYPNDVRIRYMLDRIINRK